MHSLRRFVAIAICAGSADVKFVMKGGVVYKGDGK